MTVRYSNNIDKAQSISRKVLDKITDYGLPPKPSIFTVWYSYYSGLYPEIEKILNERINDGEAISPEFCDDIYEKHLSTEKEKEAIVDAGRKLQQALAEITTALNSTGAKQQAYSKDLLITQDKLGEATSIDSVKGLIENLVDDTKKMVDENHKLEMKLNRSSVEMEEMRQNMESLRREALTDPLTGLPNRKSFETELRIASADALDNRKPLSMLMIDIDHFKNFNDTFGHQVGDQVLRLVSRSLVDGIKGQDMAARFGGEEFVVVLPDTNLRNAEKVAETLRKRIAAKDIINQTKGEKLGRLTISLGVSELHPGEPLHHLIERADKGLYKAKDDGRNCVVAVEYDPKLHKNREEEDIVVDVRG